MPAAPTPRSGLLALLLPEEPRRLPGHRALKIVLRGLHTLAAGVLVGAHLLEAGPAAQATWLGWTVLSGCAMLALDLYESGAFLLQLRGLVLLGKLAVVLALGHFGEATGLVLAALLVVAVVSSHAPSKVRYLVLVGRGRVRGATSKG